MPPLSTLTQLRILLQTLSAASPETKTLYALLQALPTYLEQLGQEQPLRAVFIDGVCQQVQQLQSAVAEQTITHAQLENALVAIMSAATQESH